MKTKFFIVVVFFASFIGCAKEESDPSKLVFDYFKAVTSGDSTTLIKVYTKDVRERLIAATDSMHTVKRQMEIWGGTHVDVKISEVIVDSGFPNLARVYFKAKVTGKKTLDVDSVYFSAFKEDGQWKLNSELPQYKFPR